MKEENKARWRPRVRADVEWDTLITVPEAEGLKVAEVKSRRETSSRHAKIPNDGSLTSSVESLSKADAKKMRRIQRQEDLESKSLKQKGKAQGEDTEHKDDKEEDDTKDEASGDEEEQSEQYEQPPYLSIGLIGQPK